jgi:hypothetical protein
VSERRWGTARDVATRLGVAPETVLVWHRQGLIPGYRLPGTVLGRLRFDLDEIDAVIESRATADPRHREVSATRGLRVRLEEPYGESATRPVRAAQTEEVP